jgi:xanthine dehydrogenase YagS FAD-binding subunit
MRAFAYERADTVAAAVARLAATPGARLLAGGTTLYDLMKLDVEHPAHIIDVNGARELTGFDAVGRGDIVIGSLARMADVAADQNVIRRVPVLSEALAKAASQQLRNMASIGGNLLQRTRCGYFRGGEPFACNKRAPGSGCDAIGGIDRGHAVLGGSEACIAVYPGDLAIALTSLDARVDVTSVRGGRSIPIAELYRRPGTTPHLETTLAADELIVRVVVPAPPFASASTYHKIRDRESYAFALASAAVALDVRGGTVREARIALGGLATVPWRATAAERGLVGRKFDRAAADEAGRVALADARPGRHNAFRIELGRRTVADALMIAAERDRA